MQVQMSLVDYLSYRMGCTFLSDLHSLDDGERIYICGVLREISPTDVSLREWNDALTYLTNASPEKTQQAARERLLELLSAQARGSEKKRYVLP